MFNYFGYNINDIRMQYTFQFIDKYIKNITFIKFSMSSFIDSAISTYQEHIIRKNNG